MVVARVCTYLSQAIMCGSSWLLVVAIERVRTIQLFVREVVSQLPL